MVFNTYHHTRTCLDEKIEIDEKKFQKIFSLPISLRVTLKLSLRSRFSAKKHFFVFCRNFGFNLEKSSNHYSQLKKQVKVDPETRSYDFLTKTREKNPMSGNILILGMTLGFHFKWNLNFLRRQNLIFQIPTTDDRKLFSDKYIWRIFQHFKEIGYFFLIL